ncbi:hypothetical protein [Microbacterium elymi]|uniref:hypothetical protein n=1 Tax=Microbacterium elymi TaxID=2909587 RepID=UPI00338F2913
MRSASRGISRWRRKLIDDDPALAHEHALAASRHAGRIPVARETVAITAYALGDYALALRELRTYRRLSGREDQIALMVDSERGVGRPERALEVGRSVERSTLPADVRVQAGDRDVRGMARPGGREPCPPGARDPRGRSRPRLRMEPGAVRRAGHGPRRARPDG